MQSSEKRFTQIFLEERYDLQQLSDAKLRTDDGCIFDVHKVMLMRSSGFFRAIFYEMDKEMRELEIPGISGQILSEILCYVYTGYIHITERNVRDLILAADCLMLKDLHKEIKQNIKHHMTVVNCLRILRATHQISDTYIFRECFRFIQTRFEDVMRCQKNDLADLPLEILISILSNRSLYVYKETTVWQAIVEWTQDIPLRMRNMPQLLLTLDIGDMEIPMVINIALELRSKSSIKFFEPKSYRYSIELLSALTDFLTRVMEAKRHVNPSLVPIPLSQRIPLQLHVLFDLTKGYDEAGSFPWNMYITYDENLDLWRKITERKHKPEDMVAIGHNIYIIKRNRFKKFDLRAMHWVRLRSLSHNFSYRSAVSIDAYIYVLGEISSGRDSHYQIEVYDTANNRWIDEFSRPLRIIDPAAVAIKEKIYVVCKTAPYKGTMVMMFDTVTKLWSIPISPPTFGLYIWSEILLAYHQKMYLSLSDSDLNTIFVFDPSTNLWNKLPDPPYTYLKTSAVVFNDHLIFYDGDTGYQRNTKNVRWNDEKECWEKLDQTDILKDFNLLHLQPFCTVNDVETIRMITKQNRDPAIKMDKTHFY